MITENFSRKEVACKCGCGMDLVSPELMTKLQECRNEYGKPMILNCVCRCPKHNAEVGGVPDSAHIATEKKVGQAADVAVADNHERYELMKIFIQHFTRIEDALTWIHVDVDLDKPQRTLFRDSRNKGD